MIILLIVWGLLFILITVYSQLTRQTLVSEVRRTNENMLRLYASHLDSLFTEINRCLANTDLRSYPEDPNQLQLSGQLSDYVLLYDDKFSFCFFDSANIYTILRTASNINYSERNDILDYLNDPDHYSGVSRWQLISHNSRYYLMRFYHYNDYHIGSWISLENVLNLYKNNYFTENAMLYLSSPEGDILTGTAAESDNRQYLVLDQSILDGGLNLTLKIPYQQILASFRFVTIIQWLIIAAFALSVAVILYYINYFLFKPLHQLAEAMEEVKNGNYRISLSSDEVSSEYQTVYEAFNSMVSEIDYLKTSVYEREIYNQQLELEKLQLQVKPHFYLNCLNIIYNLAQGGDFALIQELCMAQINYFRYMLKSSFSAVTIREEFAHIENYLHIQQLRYPGRYDIEMSLNSDINNALIPPLILHVFAENMVKHVSSYGKISFSINARKIDDSSIMISIMDNGPGFPDDILEKLKNGEDLSDDSGTHIGISNCVKRLHLYYKDNCNIIFQNQQTGGALVLITIPANFEGGDR